MFISESEKRQILQYLVQAFEQQKKIAEQQKQTYEIIGALVGTLEKSAAAITSHNNRLEALEKNHE